MPSPDHLLSLEGKRVEAILAGEKIRGRLISVRDGFLTIEPWNGPRISINQFEMTSISEDVQRQSRSPRLTRTFWK
ncbi:MAG: hypothetical protein ABR985_21485 [Methanotrichaceae archaeon]|jgi:hypothetical protein